MYSRAPRPARDLMRADGDGLACNEPEPEWSGVGCPEVRSRVDGAGRGGVAGMGVGLDVGHGYVCLCVCVCCSNVGHCLLSFFFFQLLSHLC